MGWINKIHQGNALEVLKQMPSEFVHCIVTSPPYWGLRDYKIEPQIWDEKIECKHEWGDKTTKEKKETKHSGTIKKDGYKDSFRNSQIYLDHKADVIPTSGQFCIHCGAWKGHLGLEPEPELYVQHLVEIFREARRVLRKDGVLWLNLGSSYYGSGGASGQSEDHINLGKTRKERTYATEGVSQNKKHPYFKPKDLVPIPWMVAMALQQDGWWLRSDCIWSKENCLPESCLDRATRSHEYVFLLTKSRTYFYDANAVREPVKNSTIIRYKYPNDGGGQKLSYGDKFVSRINPIIEKPGRKEKTIEQGRNLRTVWNISTKSYKFNHFACFPERLAQICILAGTSEKGCCKKCGKPWKRVTEHISGIHNKKESHRQRKRCDGLISGGTESTTIGGQAGINITTEWEPQCNCNDSIVQCIVLDPFIGSGTVAKVAARLDRSWIGIELSPEYVELGNRRTNPELKQPSIFRKMEEI